MIIKALPALILIFFIWPITLGAALGIKENIDRYLIGFAAVQALFFLVYIPAICFFWSSRVLTYTAALLITIVGVGGALLRYNRSSSRKSFLAITKPNITYFKNPFFLLAIGIILYEMWIYLTKEPYIYGDDTTYISLITQIVDTDAIYTKWWTGQIENTPINEISIKYVFTSYYPFISMMSVLSGIRPLILCKTIIPLFYVPIHYLIVWRICRSLFDSENDLKSKIKKESCCYFLYTLLIEMGQISYYAFSRRVTIWIYNNKSNCFCLLLVILFFYTYILISENENCDRLLIDNRPINKKLVIIIIAIACNSASLMGVLFSAIIVFQWMLIVAIKKKDMRIFTSNISVLLPHIVTLIVLACYSLYMNSHYSLVI